MKERTKLILGGVWVCIITLTSVWLLSLFQCEYYYSVVVLVWAFGWLSGLYLDAWSGWLKEYREKKKETKLKGGSE